MKRYKGIITILTIAICGYIGYSTNYVNTVNAGPPTTVKVIEVPKIVDKGFNMNIDLNSGKVVANASQDISVSIQKKDSIITRWKTKVICKTKYQPVIMLPGIKQEKTFVSRFAKIPNNRISVSDNTQRDN